MLDTNWFSTTDKLPPEGMVVKVYQSEFENYPAVRKDSIEQTTQGWCWKSTGKMYHSNWAYLTNAEIEGDLENES